MLANEINTQSAFNGAVTPRTVFGLQVQRRTEEPGETTSYWPRDPICVGGGDQEEKKDPFVDQYLIHFKARLACCSFEAWGGQNNGPSLERMRVVCDPCGILGVVVQILLLGLLLRRYLREQELFEEIILKDIHFIASKALCNLICHPVMRITNIWNSATVPYNIPF